jgi:hypothetical protein
MNETLMHGIDLSQAAQLQERLPQDLAVDGIDEALSVFLHRMHRRGHAAELTAPVCLRAVDAEQSWVVQPAPRGDIPAQASPVEVRRTAVGDLPTPVVNRGHRNGVDLVEAPAGVLLKVLWKREQPTHPGVRMRGDTDRIARFLASRLTS